MWNVGIYRGKFNKKMRAFPKIIGLFSSEDKAPKAAGAHPPRRPGPCRRREKSGQETDISTNRRHR